MHHQIDSLAYNNRLRSLPPEQKFGFAIALFLLGYVAPFFIQGLIILWMTVWIVKYAGIPIKVYLKLLAIPLSFWLMSLPALLIGISFNPDFLLDNYDILIPIKTNKITFYISQQGLNQGKTALIRIITLTNCMYFILLTIPFVEIIRVLKKWGCPSLLTELIALMYRFIFILSTTAMEILTAQSSRLGYSSWRSAFRSFSLLIGQLLWRTLENYRQISLGLASRGFQGELKVWHSYPYKIDWRYLMEAIGGYCLLLILWGLDYVNGI